LQLVLSDRKEMHMRVCQSWKYDSAFQIANIVRVRGIVGIADPRD
jgi:hypothetical protein